MKTAKMLYPDFVDGYYNMESDYHPMLKEFGNILLQEDQLDWSGDSWILYQDGERYGYLCFGWGSCSACDALQSCNLISEIQELMNELQESIKWFDTKQQAYDWFLTHDWQAEYFYIYEDSKNFVAKAIDLLSI